MASASVLPVVTFRGFLFDKPRHFLYTQTVGVFLQKIPQTSMTKLGEPLMNQEFRGLVSLGLCFQLS